MENSFPWEGLYLVEGEKLYLVEGEKQPVMNCNPDSCLPVLLEEEGELKRREKWWEGVFKVLFNSHFPALILLVINSINISNWNLFGL